MSVAPSWHNKRCFLLGAACLQNSLTTGLLFGFSALQPALEKINGVGEPSDDIVHVFTLAITANMLAPLLLAGPILDAFGPRVCSCVSTGLVGAGFLLFGVSAALPGGSRCYLLPSMILIGVGGPGCQSSLFHTANLFQARGLALNLITACIGPSFGMFEQISGLGKQYGLSLQRAFLLYSSLPLGLMLLSALTMSDVPFSSLDAVTSQDDSDKSTTTWSALDKFMSRVGVSTRKLSIPGVGGQHVRAVSFGAARPMAFIRRKRTTHKRIRTNGSTLYGPLLNVHPSAGEGHAEDLNGLQKEELRSSLLDQLCSFPFAELTLVFTMSSLFYNMFIGNMQDQAEAALLTSSTLPGDTSAAASKRVSTYLRFSPLSGLLNPILGFCIDQCGFGPMLAIVLLSGATHAITLCYGAFYVSAAIFSLFTNSMFAYMFSYLALEFGFDYYGLLAGVIQCVASIATLILQPCLRHAAVVYSWQNVQLFEVIMFGLLASWITITRLLRRLLQSRGHQEPTHAVKRCSESSQHAPLGRRRSYSMGDLHDLPSDQACRRRSDYFPVVDDILLVDGAHEHVSRTAYQLESNNGQMCVVPAV